MFLFVIVVRRINEMLIRNGLLRYSVVIFIIIVFIDVMYNDIWKVFRIVFV